MNNGAGSLQDLRYVTATTCGLEDAQALDVDVREQGREWHYTLDARPLAAVYEHWLLRFAPLWEESLQRLKARAEAPSRQKPVAKSRA